ncbi:hypothetical protein HG531_011699 [Fusarium graminearum]|nr:hypothetical protein HG531_011699 [Fusarium graminearum]
MDRLELTRHPFPSQLVEPLTGAVSVLVVLLFIAGRDVPDVAAVLALLVLRRRVCLTITVVTAIVTAVIAAVVCIAVTTLAITRVAIAAVAVTGVVVTAVVVTSVAVSTVAVARVVVSRVTIARVSASTVAFTSVTLATVSTVAAIVTAVVTTAVGFALAVNLDTVHKPVGVLEGRRVAGNIVVALSQGCSLRVLVPDIGRAGPITAESSVEDDVVVSEVVVDVAALTSVELGSGSSPGCRIGVARLNVLGNTTAVEEPDSDVVRSPLGGVDSAANVVETITIVLVISGALAATLARTTSVAVVVDESSALIGAVVGDSAARSSVKSDLVLSLSADALEDVYFPVIGPRTSRREHPKCRPNTRDTARHVGDIGDEETVGERVVRNLSVNETRQTLAVGTVGIDVLDKSIGRILFVEELECLEEVGGVFLLYLDLQRYRGSEIEFNDEDVLQFKRK